MQEDVKLPLFEFAKKQKLYHFDVDKPDDDDLIFKPKFKCNWKEELKNFKPMGGTPFELERLYSRMQIEEWINLDYDFAKWLKKMIPDETTPILKKISKSIPFDKEEIMQVQIHQQKPGQYVPYHMDVMASTGISSQKVIEKGYRVILFLTDWMPGQFMIWGTTVIQKWKAGHVLAWPALKYPHGTSNASHGVRYTMRFSGLATDEFHSWLKSDKIEEIK
jgi:hypothetical protein